jgi:hypothetical protein
LDADRVAPLPAMRFFQGKDDFWLLVDDVIETVSRHDYKMIKCFATNTLESQAGTATFRSYAGRLLQHLDEHHIHVDLYLGNGILLLEQMVKTQEKKILADLPAGQASLMVLIIGGVVYILLFKQQPAGIKIESQELSDVLTFLLKQM